MWKDCNVVMLSHEKEIIADPKKPLYITSNEDIKEGDTYINEEGRLILHRNKLNPKGKKIIATTDLSLELPSIPQWFIKHFVAEYNKGNVIDKVEVRYDQMAYESGDTFFELRLTQDRTISIKEVEEKMYNREEVENKLQKFRLYSLKFGLDANVSNKWIIENL